MCPKTKPSCNSGHTRRGALQTGALLLAGFAACAVGRPVAAAQSMEIRMRSLAGGARVSFDPIGLLVARGATVRWVVEAGVHTTTAYHPDNESHPLRIPEGARPWDSGCLCHPAIFQINDSTRSLVFTNSGLALIARMSRPVGCLEKSTSSRSTIRPGRGDITTTSVPK